MAEIVAGFNNMRGPKFHFAIGKTKCMCGCLALCCRPITGALLLGAVVCQSQSHTYSRSSHLWEQCLCPKSDEQEWHDLKCIKGECGKCGFQNVPLCEWERDPENEKLLEWKKFEMAPADTNRIGEPKTVIRLKHKLTSARIFIDHAASKIPPFLIHQHTARWQDTQYRQSIDKLKPRELMSLIDYVENYTFKGLNEIQSQHWFNFQLTILVHITYRVNPQYNILDSKSKRHCTEYFYYISDDPKHDSLFVQHCLNKHWAWLCATEQVPVHHIVWSDGCAAQFKGATAFFYVAKSVFEIL